MLQLIIGGTADQNTLVMRNFPFPHTSYGSVKLKLVATLSGGKYHSDRLDAICACTLL